jgi:HSP20 family molecular chaperone IbpA
MARHGAYAAFAGNEAGLPHNSIGRELPALFNLAELRTASRAQALLRDAWFPGIGVMASRVREGSAQGLYVAAEAGNNGKSHNHNDVGNFIVYANGEPAIIDVGVETYTAKTFSSRRYEIWTMQSAFHNCPTIDGVMQSPGRQFAASAVNCHQDDQAAELRMDLAGAYPKNANVESWKRVIRLERTRNQVEVIDDYSLNQSAKEITLTLMTPCRVTQQPGSLQLEDRARVAYDPALSASVEEIKLDDPHLRSVWGERIYRILLRTENPSRQGKWSLRITQA